MPSLVVITSDGQRCDFQIGKEKITIGRNKDNDLILSDKTVSRHHAQITKTKLGYLLTDLGSINHTKVNEEKIQRVLLKHNDEIRLGRSRLVFLAKEKERASLEDSPVLTPDSDYEDENGQALKGVSESGATDSQGLLASVDDTKPTEPTIAPTSEKTQAELEREKEVSRIEVRWPITVLTDEGPIEGETRNITAAGMFIRCQDPLRVNETYRISVRPPNRQAIELSCKVMWSNLYGIDGQDTAYAMGFHFVKVSDEDRRFLSDTISAH